MPDFDRQYPIARPKKVELKCFAKLLFLLPIPLALHSTYVRTYVRRMLAKRSSFISCEDISHYCKTKTFRAAKPPKKKHHISEFQNLRVVKFLSHIFVTAGFRETIPRLLLKNTKERKKERRKERKKGRKKEIKEGRKKERKKERTIIQRAARITLQKLALRIFMSAERPLF